MPGVRSARKDFNAQRAAYLWVERELTQGEIGLVMELSQSQVSRLLKFAEHQGWVERLYRLVPGTLPEGRLEELRRSATPAKLVERLNAVDSQTGVRVSNVHVVETASRGTTLKAINLRQHRFGRDAASTVLEFATQSEVFAVTWGHTLSAIVDAIGPIVETAPLRSTVQFVPVCGEPMSEKSNPDTSTHLAMRLHAVMKITVPVRPPSLTGMPALIPRRYRGSDAVSIRKFVTEATSYREMFGGRSPLIQKVDTLLTSVGPAKRPMGFINEELLTAGSLPGDSLTRDQLERLVVGDLGGVLLPRRTLDRAGLKKVDELNSMWTGIRREHYERIARRAARSNRPGVIVASFGDDGRADTIAEIVRCGLVNQLIIDRQLADTLTEKLATSTSGRP